MTDRACVCTRQTHARFHSQPPDPSEGQIVSHFTVLVISQKPDDVESLLAPFNEQPDDDDSPLLDAIVEEVEIGRAREWLTKIHAATPGDKDLWRSKEHAPAADADDMTLARWFEGRDDLFVQDGRIVYVYHRNGDAYGPDHGLVKGAKWDWWAVGGRWLGSLPLKDGADTAVATIPEESRHWTGRGPRFPGGVDQAPKGAVDIDRIRRDAATAAVEEWDAYAAIVETHGPLPDDTWTKFEDKTSPEFEEARNAYWSHPTIKALQKADVIGLLDMPNETFGRGMTREAYIAGRVDNALPGFALLNHDGQWYEPGAMGWFGASTDSPESRRRFNRRVNELLDAAPDDYFLTVVDCHI